MEIEQYECILNELLRKINFCNDFISLYLRKSKLLPHLRSLEAKTNDVMDLMNNCSEVLKEHQNTALERYQYLKRKMQMQLLSVINILTALKKRAREQGTGQDRKVMLQPPVGNNMCVTPLSTCQKNKSNASMAQRLLNKGPLETPKMYLSDYEQSPFVRRKKPVPVPFQFLDFEVNITQEMFESVPKYMRGRETLEELNQFLDTLIVPCFNDKYQLLHRQRDCIRNSNELEMWKLYRDQTRYFPGQMFITQGDISKKTGKMLDRKSQNKITMLRHLGVLQEQRKSQVVCYIWTANSAA